MILKAIFSFDAYSHPHARNGGADLGVKTTSLVDCYYKHKRFRSGTTRTCQDDTMMPLTAQSNGGCQSTQTLAYNDNVKKVEPYLRS